MDCDIIERIAASGGLANIQSRDLLPLFFGLVRPEKCLRKRRTKMEIETMAYALHREQEGSAFHTLWFFSLPLSSESPSPSGSVRTDPGTVPSNRHKRSLKVPRTYTGHHPASLLPPITASDRPALTRSESDAIVPPLSLAPVSSPATTASSKIVRPAHPRITALSPGCPLHNAAEHAPTRPYHRPATDSTSRPGTSSIVSRTPITARPSLGA